MPLPPLLGSIVSWLQLQPLLVEFWRLVSGHIEPRARAGRLKQWLNYLRRRHPEAGVAYAAVRTINDPLLVASWLGIAPRSAPRQEHDSQTSFLEVVA